MLIPDKTNLEATWQEKGATLYQLKNGVWVLYRYSSRHPFKLLSETERTARFRLAGRAQQIEARAAAEWLVGYNYSLPPALQAFEQEITAVRGRVPAAPEATRRPVAASKRVALYGLDEKPEIDGSAKAPLNQAPYDVVYALIQAGKTGLTKERLDQVSNHPDARRIMERLAAADDDWKKVLVFPGGKGRGGYRIR